MSGGPYISEMFFEIESKTIESLIKIRATCERQIWQANRSFFSEKNRTWDLIADSWQQSLDKVNAEIKSRDGGKIEKNKAIT